MGKIKRDDEVVVITGRDKGKRGKIVRVLDNDRVIVSGINMIKRHTKANPQLGTAGGILEKEASMHVYNVGLVNPVTGEIYLEAGDEIDDKTLKVLLETGEEEIDFLDIDNVNVTITVAPTGGSVVVRVTGDAPGIVIGTTSAVDVEVAMPVEGWSSL